MQKRYPYFILIAVIFLFSIPAFAKDEDIKKAIIAESLASYPGPCPCPYNNMRNGRACGGRSAYSKPGGYSPICYERDVTSRMLQEYKSRH